MDLNYELILHLRRWDKETVFKLIFAKTFTIAEWIRLWASRGIPLFHNKEKDMATEIIKDVNVIWEQYADEFIDPTMTEFSQARLKPTAVSCFVLNEIRPYLEHQGMELPSESFKVFSIRAETKQEKNEAPVNGSYRGRSKFPYEDNVAKVIKKLCNKKIKPKKGEMPFHIDIISAFAPGKEMCIDKNTTPDEYKKQTGWKPSTIEKLVRKYYF